jgi:hypothetical protein
MERGLCTCVNVVPTVCWPKLLEQIAENRPDGFRCAAVVDYPVTGLSIVTLIFECQ